MPAVGSAPSRVKGRRSIPMPAVDSLIIFSFLMFSISPFHTDFNRILGLFVLHYCGKLGDNNSFERVFLLQSSLRITTYE